MDIFLEEAGNKELAGLYVSQTYLSVLYQLDLLFLCLKQVTVEDQRESSSLTFGSPVRDSTVGHQQPAWWEMDQPPRSHASSKDPRGQGWPMCVYSALTGRDSGLAGSGSLPPALTLLALSYMRILCLSGPVSLYDTPCICFVEI